MLKLRTRQKYAALAQVTGLLAVNFWAWSLISPLANSYKAEFNLSATSVSALVAAPILVGSLGRIPLGLLADRFGGQKLFALVCLLSSAAVGSLALAGSYHALLAAAFGLGVAGASFAAGVPFINSWFPKNQRGLALGIFAVGNAGTALSGLVTTRLADTLGKHNLFYLIALMLLITGLTFWRFGSDGPGRRSTRSSSLKRLSAAISWELTWKLSLLYALTFGAFVSLGLYLPVLLHQSYALDPTDAAARAAGFVLLATAMRPLGGWLSDRLSGLVVLRAVCLGIFLMAILAAYRPTLAPFGTVSYLGLAAVLGIGNGAIFAVIGHRCPANFAGTVTGLVGAAGGLGGYLPPFIMGFSYQVFNSYTLALGLFALAGLALFLSLRRLFGFSSRY
jgi:NNP family nitrate/nitrite transporter-like MFS transporter